MVINSYFYRKTRTLHTFSSHFLGFMKIINELKNRDCVMLYLLVYETVNVIERTDESKICVNAIIVVINSYFFRKTRTLHMFSPRFLGFMKIINELKNRDCVMLHLLVYETVNVIERTDESKICVNAIIVVINSYFFRKHMNTTP